MTRVSTAGLIDFDEILSYATNQLRAPAPDKAADPKAYSRHKRTTALQAYYTASYPAICEATETLCHAPNNQTLYALCNLVYGWMPRIPRNAIPRAVLDQTTTIIEILQRAKRSSDALKLFEITQGKAPINNSWVGTSKLLHFVNPTVFPIWDSKIARHFGMTYRAQYEREVEYRDYITKVHEWAKSTNLASFQNLISPDSKQTVSKIRAVEYALFLSSGHTPLTHLKNPAKPAP